MSLAPVEGQPLWENHDAREFHEEAMHAKKAGEFDRAHQLLGEAAHFVEDEPETGDQLIQLARITRDDGFTYTQEAAAEHEASFIPTADETLDRARDITGRVIDSFGPDAGHEKRVLFCGSVGSSWILRANLYQGDAFAEHCATQTLMGRTATVREVLVGADPRGKNFHAQLERDFYQRHYGEAHRSGLLGNNGYYRVVNGVSAMRQVRVNGALQSPYLLPWMSRTAAALEWTRQHDARNLHAAERHLGHLREIFVPRPLVIKAVLAHP